MLLKNFSLVLDFHRFAVDKCGEILIIHGIFLIPPQVYHQ